MDAAITNINIVLLGKFAPDSFLPRNLAEAKVISQKSAELATLVALVPRQTVHFKLNWSELEVTTSRIIIRSLEAPHIRISDFVLKALGEMAPDSTVTQFGINVDCHYDLGSVDARNELGRRIAPPEAWGTWGKSLMESMDGEVKGTPLQGGMKAIVMKLPFVNSKGLAGWRDITLTASTEVKGLGGVLFRSNHHHQLKPLDFDDSEEAEPAYDSKTTALMLSALSSSFEKSIEDAISIFDGALAS